MRNLVSVFACCCIVAIFPPQNLAEEIVDPTGPYTQQVDVVCGQSHGLAVVMDIFQPTGKANGLAIVDVASGAWSSDRGKIRDHQLAMMYDIFCGKGYTVFAVRPGSVSRYSALDMVQNVEVAIRWVKDHGSKYNIDVDRIGLTGASAGGHLALLTMVRKKEPIAAVGVFFPPTDFVKFGDTRIDPAADDRVSRLVARLAFPEGVAGLSDQAITAGLEAISPARQVTANLPPCMLIHGDADRVVPLQQSEAFRTALETCQVDVQLIVKSGGGHPWLTIPREVKQLADWFDRKLTARTSDGPATEE